MSSSPLPHSFHLHSPLSLPLPFLCQALKALNKKDLSEVKAYNNPPEQVETVMQAVMILKQSEPTWAEAKRQLGEANFIKQLVEFDKDNMSDKTLKRIGQYCARPDFKPDIVGRVSLAAKSLCMWVGAMEVYGRIFRVVEPKKKVCLCARGGVFSINCFLITVILLIISKMLLPVSTYCKVLICQIYCTGELGLSHGDYEFGCR